MNISIPVTLIDNKNEVDKANSNSLKKDILLLLDTFSNRFKLRYVHNNQTLIKGISLGLNSECPNK